MARARSAVRRNAINSLNHMAAQRWERDTDTPKRERFALIYAAAIVVAAIEIGTIDELEIVAGFRKPRRGLRVPSGEQR